MWYVIWIQTKYINKLQLFKKVFSILFNCQISFKEDDFLLGFVVEKKLA